MLKFERNHPADDMPKFGLISTTFGINSVRYAQRLNQIIETREALETDPVTVHRLLRMRHRRDLDREERRFHAVGN